MNNCFSKCFSLKQIQTLTARPPACLQLSLPATATSRTTAQTWSPNKDARLRPSSLSWIVPTGKGKRENWTRLKFFFFIFVRLTVFPPLFRQKVCCGIIYKGRFGEVIIDPRLFKPCCSSKKQTSLAPAQVSTLSPQLPEDTNAGECFCWIPSVGQFVASTWICLQWQTSFLFSLFRSVHVCSFFSNGYFLTFV